MKKILYGVAGEGLGHCSRTYAVIEELKEYEVHVFTYGDAYDFFKKLNYPHLHLIPGIKFGRKNERIDTFLTFNKCVEFTRGLKTAIGRVKLLANEIKPTVVISDFEPILPRVAKQLSVPLISIDNQHKFSRCPSRDLPLGLRAYCIATGMLVERFVPDPDYVVISTFYHNLTKSQEQQVTMSNVFMRKAFLNDEPIKDHGFALVYYKASVGPKMLEALSHQTMPVVVYGVPKSDQRYSFTYKDLSYEEFAVDLKSCRVVFGAAGNQLLGEAAYFGKPLFVVPEPNQYEQYVNGWYVEKAGLGICRHRYTSKTVKDFLDTLPTITPSLENGVDIAAKIIRKAVEQNE